MKIEVSKLNAEIVKFENLIEKLEDIYLNYYNQINSCSFFWQDKHEIKFMDQAKEEKRKYMNMINELKNISDIYSYLIREYQKIGRKIVVDLGMKNEVNNYFNKYINEINNLIYEYNRLDLSFCYDVRSYLLKEKDRLNKTKNDILSIRQKVRETFNEIEQIEKQIQLNISKLNIEIIKENSITGLY